MAQPSSTQKGTAPPHTPAHNTSSARPALTAPAALTLTLASAVALVLASAVAAAAALGVLSWPQRWPAAAAVCAVCVAPAAARGSKRALAAAVWAAQWALFAGFSVVWWAGALRHAGAWVAGEDAAPGRGGATLLALVGMAATGAALHWDVRPGSVPGANLLLLAVVAAWFVAYRLVAGKVYWTMKFSSNGGMGSLNGCFCPSSLSMTGPLAEPL